MWRLRRAGGGKQVEGEDERKRERGKKRKR